MRRLGLTGATGVLGRTIRAQWTDVQWSLFPGRIERREELTQWLRQSEPLDGIIHLAAMVPVSQVEERPLEAFRVNVEGSLNLLEAVRSLSQSVASPWIFFASSSHVYASSSLPLREDSRLEPVTRYGLTKLQAEQWASFYRATYKLDICVGRIFSFSSPLQHSSFFIPSWVQKIRSAPSDAVLEIPGLLGSRDFLDAGQICRAIRFLFEKRAVLTLNIASGLPLSLAAVAEGIKSKLGRSDVQIRALDVGTNHLIADVHELHKLGLELRFDLDAFLEEMIHD